MNREGSDGGFAPSFSRSASQTMCGHNTKAKETTYTLHTYTGQMQSTNVKEEPKWKKKNDEKKGSEGTEKPGTA